MIRKIRDMFKTIILNPSTSLPVSVSTESNQLTIISLIDSVESSQTILQTLLETIQQLVSRVAFLDGVRGSAADLRVTPLSLPTLATVTTVGTVTNQTNIGGYTATPVVPSFQNMVAIQSNINNVVV